jgi:hypothetical protein
VKSLHRYFGIAVLSAAFVLPVMVTAGCAGRVTYGARVYDPGYRDYHDWNDNEVVFYRQYLNERHQPYREFRRLNRGQQREYWEWRHKR